MFSQYSWVLKVLESCENYQQIETSKKLFELYVKKWNKDNKQINCFITNFEKEKNSKTLRLKKKNTFFSKFSHFFLF